MERRVHTPSAIPTGHEQARHHPQNRGRAPLKGRIRRAESGPGAPRVDAYAPAPGSSPHLEPLGGMPDMRRTAPSRPCHASQPRCAFGGCRSLAQSPEAPLHQIRAQPGSVRPGLTRRASTAHRWRLRILPKVAEDLFDHRPLRDRRDDLQLPSAAVRTPLHVDVKAKLQRRLTCTQVMSEQKTRFNSRAQLMRCGRA